MKKLLSWILTSLFALTLFFNGFAQKDNGDTKDLKKVWQSANSPGDKAIAVKQLNLKEAELSPADLYAYHLILYQANQSKDAGMRSMIQKFEALTPAGKKELSEQYPKIVSAYETYAASKNLPIYHFQAELKTSITFKEFGKKVEKNTAEPGMYTERMRFYTIAMQRELYESRNLIILPTFKKIVNLWSALTQQQKEALDHEGYPNYWKELLSLYNHKFLSKDWACTCGTDQSVFPNLPECGEKVIPIPSTEKDLDEAALALVAFNMGDLSNVPNVLQDPDLATYSGSKNDILKQLVFWHLSALSGAKINSSNKISLVSLWDKGEANGSNDYLHRIGFTREILTTLENYYTCLLGVKGTVPAETKKPADIAIDTTGIPIPVVKEVIKEAPQRTTFTRPTDPLKKISAQTNIVEIRDVWDAAVQNEITNRENLKLCAETRVVNDSTLELDLKGCGDGKGTFKILETETPLVGEFFSYCTNALSDLLVSYRKDIGGTYKVHITGTADTLSYHDNQSLANARAEFVKANLGKKLVADCEDKDITTEGLIDQPERKVTIRVTLYKPRS